MRSSSAAILSTPQHKDELADPGWQDLPANITFIGNTGYISDPAPPIGKRFYRVLLNP